MIDVDVRIIGFICVVVILVVIIATAYSAYRKRKLEKRETLYLNEPNPYLPNPKVIYNGGGEDYEDNGGNEDEPCCSGDSDMLTLMIIALLNKAMTKNSKVANAECVQRVVKHTIPQVMLRLGAYGIDMNSIDYGNPSIVNTVNAIIVDIIQEAMRDPEMCAEEPYPPAKCPTQIIDVDVPACENCGNNGTTSLPPSGTTTTRPPGGSTTTTKPPTTTPKGGTTTKPPTTTPKGGTTTKPPTCPTPTTKPPTCATTSTAPPTCRTTSKAPTTLPLCTPTPTGTVAPAIPEGTYFIVSVARNNGKCEQYLSATSCSSTPTITKPWLSSTVSLDGIWMLKKLPNKQWLIQSNSRDGNSCANNLSTNACTVNGDLVFSTQSTALQTWAMELVEKKPNVVRFKNVGRTAPKCKTYLSAQNCGGSQNVELNDLDIKTLNQEWQLVKATRDTLYEGDCLWSGEALYRFDDTTARPITASLSVDHMGDVLIKDHEKNTVWSLRNTAQHARDSLMGKANGPFRLCMEKTGELILYNVKNAWVWRSDTVGKANGPFQLKLMRDDTKKVSYASIYQSMYNATAETTTYFEIWNNGWSHSCEIVRQWYVKQYPEIGKTDPWQHYSVNVLQKQGAQKERRLWPGPKCDSCDKAKAWYNDLYPDVVTAKMDAATHYYQIGAKENRMWKGIGSNDACINLPNLEGEILLGVGTDSKLYTKASLRDPWALVKDSNCCVRTILVTTEGWILGINDKNKLVGKSTLTGPWKEFSDASNIVDIFQLTTGEIAGIGKDEKLYKKTTLYAPWEYFAPHGRSNSMDLLKENKYMGIGKADNQLYIRDNPAAGTWTVIKDSGAVVDFVELSTGPIIGIGTNNKLYFIENRNKLPWKKGWLDDKTAGAVQRIEVLPSPHKAKPFPNRDTLFEGECLKSGQELVSADGKHKFTIDATGHLKVFNNGKKDWSAAEDGEHTRIPNIPFQGPFTICLKTDGNLQQEDAKKTWVWNTDSANKAEGPFKMQIQNDGHLVIRGAKGLPVWAHRWPHSCEQARKWYLDNYKEVANAKQDPWEHYKSTVLNRAKGKEVRQWPGPKCGSCDEAAKWYNELFPDVKKANFDPALHYKRHGQGENRIWKGPNNNRCITVLHEGFCLEKDEKLVSSNGKYVLAIDQTSGEGLVFIDGPQGRVWSSHNQHQRKEQVITNKAPYTFCMTNEGELVQANKLKERIWGTDTKSKAAGPFRAEVNNDGQLIITGKHRMTGADVQVWNSTWPHDCQSAKDLYLATHKDVVLHKVDAWKHYEEAVLKQPDASKERREWHGPKCADCKGASDYYNELYPDIAKAKLTAVGHYNSDGYKEKRIWKGQGKRDACMPTTKPPTPAPTTPPPTTPAPVMCLRSSYAIEQMGVGAKRFKGKNPGDIPCIFPNDGYDIPQEGKWFKWYS
jgi:hypothetical protein